MKTVTLLAGHLPPSGPQFPPVCVVCGGPCDTRMFVLVDAGHAPILLRKLTGSGLQYIVPVHQTDACGVRMQREMFREEIRLELALAALGLAALLLAILVSPVWLFAYLALLAILIPVFAWRSSCSRQKALFYVEPGMDNNFRELISFSFGNEAVAKQFAAINRRSQFTESETNTL